MENLSKHYVFASDYSSSTGFCQHYHNNAEAHLERFIKHTEAISQENIHYLVWGSRCEEIPLQELFSIYYEMDGNGGSDPVTIFEWIKRNIKEASSIELWLITDGGMDRSYAENCLEYNETMYYSLVKFIIISENDDVDMLLGCSFFTNTLVEIYKNTQLFMRVGTRVDFYCSQINIGNFDKKIHFLRDFVELECKDERKSLEIAHKLSHLKARLLSEVKIEFLSATQRNQLIDIFEQSDCSDSATQNKMNGLNYEIDSELSTLINYAMIQKTYRSKNDFVNKKINFDVDKRGEEEEAMNLKICQMQK